MKRTILIGFISVFSLVLSAGSAIKFNQTTVDFGNVQSGKTAEVKFEFENIGNEMLIIHDIRASCGCTAPALAKKEYAPGEKGSISVRFNSTGYRARVSKSIAVRSNDPALTTVMLTIVGNVIDTASALAKLSSESIDFGSVRHGKSFTKTVSISNDGNVDLEIKEVQHWPDFTLIFPAKRIPPKHSIEVKVNFTPMDTNTQVALIKIVTNDPARSYLLLKAEWKTTAK